MYEICDGNVKFLKSIHVLAEKELFNNNISMGEFIEMRKVNSGSISMDLNMDVYINFVRLNGDMISSKVPSEDWEFIVSH